VPPERRRPTRDQRDDLIQRQQDEIARLREEVARAEQRRREVERERDRLKQQNERLKQQLDAARRAGFRQAAPFAKDRSQGRGGRPGRRRGPTYGRRSCRPMPSRVDETYTASIPATCPRCAGAIHLTRVATQYQEDLPVVRPIVRRFDVQVGCCATCGHRVQGRHPLQTSDALGAAAVHLGPQAVALVVVFHKHLGVPLEKIATVLRERFGLTVTPGGLVHILHRAARVAAPTYAALCEQVRGSPVVSPDETGWRVGAVLHWLWAFATPDTTVYAIRPGRGFDDAATILGATFDGVLVRDGWAPYRQFTDALHQTCLAHLLRRCRTLRDDHPRSPWAADVQQALLDALALRARRDARMISDRGLAVARGQALARFGRLIDTAPPLPATRRFAAHLSVEFAALLSFLWDPRVDATNWRAEHAIRPAVVNRKVCGGNRTVRGAHTQQVLASVVRTARQRHLDLDQVFTTLLRAPYPIVDAAFHLQTQ
jgi:transposase